MRAKGFTLIEILVVLIIIGITIGFALLSFGDFGASRRATVSAEQFSTYIKLVQQQAILEMSTLGVQVNQDNYRTFRLERDSWQLMPEKGIFHTRYFPENVIVNLQKAANTFKTPNIIIHSSGDITAFKLSFGTRKKSDIITIIARHDGQLIMQSPKSS
ncbi:MULTISPECIES: type II secretion system minor pseudopilin GspH [unclassified Legionella]|uniref:type II secretion system minor pseudopilin GspH n=1 Tax=unclassified Legionella TaxID=2622702 RepID=UPI001055E80D|nr:MULTISPECIES: type II secretion system minor pseudopilin GspH [unclassified Legionella]MDI9819498.1 type II secretion system minor pseudopilin GspH [Legionella sp. PL877]